MRTMQITELIKMFQKQKEVTSEQLCKGLCGRSTMCNYEKGKRVPDALLAQCFMERMGVEAEDFVLMVTEQEYDYYVWKEQTQIALEQSNWNYLEKLLENKETALELECNKKLQKQYYYYMTAIIETVSHKNRKQAVTYLKIAAEQTISDIFQMDSKKILFSKTELHILILYLYYGTMEKMLTDGQAEMLFEMLEEYISNRNIQLEEQAKIYPKLICVWLNISKNSYSIADRRFFCEKAIKILKETKTLYDIVELLRIYISVLEGNNEEKIHFYKKHLENFKELFQQGSMDSQFHVEILTGRRQKICLLHEYLYSKRMDKKIKQADVCQGICEPETYSRIETGKRAPLVKNLYALADRLDMSWCYYRGELETDNLKVYELRRNQRMAAIEGRWQDVLEILRKMERYLNMKQPVNYQYVKAKQYIAENYLGYLTAEEAYQKDKELLFMTVTFDITEDRLMYYSQTELEIIGHMAQMLRVQKKSEEGIILLERILKQITKSVVWLEHQWNGVDFIIRVLGGLYFAVGRYEDSNQLKRYSHKINLKIRDAGNLPEILDAIADNLEHMGSQYSEEYKMLYRQTYYVADFYNFSNIKPFAKKYYEENFDSNIKWY